MKEKFIRDVILWNLDRYNQEHEHDLTASLLYEECHEFDASRNNVERLDALADIVYVAIGAMWKMGLHAEAIEEALDIVARSNSSKTVPIVKVAKNMKANNGLVAKGPAFIHPEPYLKELLDGL